jgi:hypothetical protein
MMLRLEPVEMIVSGRRFLGRDRSLPGRCYFPIYLFRINNDIEPVRTAKRVNGPDTSFSAILSAFSRLSEPNEAVAA